MQLFSRSGRRATIAVAAAAVMTPLLIQPSTATDADQADAPLVTLDNVTPAPAAPPAPSLRSAPSQAPQAAVDYPDEIVVEDGVTQPVFGFEDAIVERVWVDTDMDSDGDGVLDTVVLDIKRPAATEDGLSSPVVMDASPYYTTVCRGNEGECKEDLDGDGLLDQFPLFYDNYFVPRGYAVVLLDTVGTGSNVTGCPDTGGDADNLSAVAGIDWLNGRREGRDAEGNPVVADWHNGHTGMIGKSYDGTLANAAAATGVEGLSTIVPITAISSWYRYSRSNGIRFNNNYQGGLSNTVTNPERRAGCAEFRNQLNIGADDATADYNDYWAERDFEKDLDNVTASVFVVHAINDWNVKPDHLAFWDGVQERDLDRKLWLAGTGHIDPFDFRREEWVDTLHRWFDHELQEVDNGIMDEPKVDVERSNNVWETYETWPLDTAEPARLFLTPGADGGAGGFSTRPVRNPGSLTFTDTERQSQNQAISNPETPGENRLVFLSEPLEADLHISGSPVVNIRARVNDVDTNFAGILVDYSTRERFGTSGSGIRTLDTRTCWGLSTEVDSACYLETERTSSTNPLEMVTKGIIDGQNLNSITEATPLVPGAANEVEIPLLPEDYVFHEGAQLGVVVLGSFSGYSSVGDQNEAEITVDLNRSSVELPVVGGRGAAARAGL